MVIRRTILSLTPIWCYGIVLMCHNVIGLCVRAGLLTTKLQ